MLKKSADSTKKAMTLAELLIVFVIMGVVAAMILVTAKPADSSLKYVYSRVYSSLGTAFYNASVKLPDYLRTGGNYYAEMTGSYPATAKTFCFMLLEYINHKETGTLDSSSKITSNCSADTIAINQSGDAMDEALNSTDPHFIASNGTKFWLAHSINQNTYSTFKFHASNAPDGEDFELRGYIVIADLNGDMRPNTTQWTQNRAADIVAFIVTEDFEVIPLGYPEIDRRYLSADVVYNTTSGIEITDANTSVPMPYYQAKRLAWGTDPGAANAYLTGDEPMSLNFYASSQMGDANFGDKNNNITGGPFFLNYTTDNAFTEYNAYYFGSNNTSYNYNHDCAEDDDQSVLDPEACYVHIKDYY